jgi:hypothetical protein
MSIFTIGFFLLEMDVLVCVHFWMVESDCYKGLEVRF